ncbi:hypothetical protein LTR15_002899 [Elasticomyces elasticus]|nr:hypothetical protein LTR15_002899 [Elasticomyces elasticus]
MRLLNLYTLKFEEFYGEEDTPAYAILSHRWTKHEISYREFVDGCDQRSAGYKKILDFCAFARSRPARVRSQGRMLENNLLQWGWLDTICIDKSSSQELSESINSMFEWYGRAAVCCAFLGDVPPLDEGNIVVAKAFAESEWFERGWTLQELLAPWDVIFCNQVWQIIGHKCTHSKDGPPLECATKGHGVVYGPALNAEISRCTSIGGFYLEEPTNIYYGSVACRMSWAAHRKTTRVEDIGYCLLGMLEVNMPLLYGEGSRAFMRLQEEIIRRSSDQSIFRWNIAVNLMNKPTGVLASYPSDFSGSSHIVRTRQPPDVPYALTNIGLEIRAPSTKIRDFEWNREVYVIKLNCGHASTSTDLVPAVMVVARRDEWSPNRYERVWCSPQVLDGQGEEVAEKLFYVRA